MRFSCQKCDYFSSRSGDLRRHQNRKTPCSSIMKENIQNTKETQNLSNDHANSSNDHANSSNDHANSSNGHVESKNIHAEGYNIHAEVKEKTSINCDKCDKTFASKYSLKTHIKKHCEGVKSNVCPRCLKTFNSRKGRNNHVRLVKCFNVSTTTQNSHQLFINNNTTNITNVHNDHCTNNTFVINNHNHIVFGKEVLDRLCKEPNYTKRMEELVRLGKYAIPQQMNDIFFNEQLPMNKTIMKTRHNDRFVKIKTGEDSWDIRAIDDIYGGLMVRMEKYMSPYFRDVEQRMEKVYDEDPKKFRKLTKDIRNFGHRVLWLDWNCDDIRRIGVVLNESYCENERERCIREMKSMLLEQIYDKTCDMLLMK